jgi:hypothetical protein
MPERATSPTTSTSPALLPRSWPWPVCLSAARPRWRSRGSPRPRPPTASRRCRRRSGWPHHPSASSSRRRSPSCGRGRRS